MSPEARGKGKARNLPLSLSLTLTLYPLLYPVLFSPCRVLSPFSLFFYLRAYRRPGRDAVTPRSLSRVSPHTPRDFLIKLELLIDSSTLSLPLLRNSYRHRLGSFDSRTLARRLQRAIIHRHTYLYIYTRARARVS